MQNKKLINLIALFSLVVVSPVLADEASVKERANQFREVMANANKRSQKVTENKPEEAKEEADTNSNNSSDEFEFSTESVVKHGGSIVAGLTLGSFSNTKHLASRTLGIGLISGIAQSIYDCYYTDELKAEKAKEIAKELEKQYQALAQNKKAKSPSKRLFKAAKEKKLENFNLEKEVELLVEEHFKLLPRTLRFFKNVGVSTVETGLAATAALAAKSGWKGNFKSTFQNLPKVTWNELKGYTKNPWNSFKAAFLTLPLLAGSKQAVSQQQVASGKEYTESRLKKDLENDQKKYQFLTNSVNEELAKESAKLENLKTAIEELKEKKKSQDLKKDEITKLNNELNAKKNEAKLLEKKIKNLTEEITLFIPKFKETATDENAARTEMLREYEKEVIGLSDYKLGIKTLNNIIKNANLTIDSIEPDKSKTHNQDYVNYIKKAFKSITEGKISDLLAGEYWSEEAVNFANEIVAEIQNFEEMEKEVGSKFGSHVAVEDKHDEEEDVNQY